MTELAAINAKIDRLNRKLKAEPIVIVGTPDKWQWVLDYCTTYDRFTTLRLESLEQVRSASRHAARSNNEDVSRLDRMFCRKIQLAILERLTG